MFCVLKTRGGYFEAALPYVVPFFAESAAPVPPQPPHPGPTEGYCSSPTAYHPAQVRSPPGDRLPARHPESECPSPGQCAGVNAVKPNHSRPIGRFPTLFFSLLIYHQALKASKTLKSAEMSPKSFPFPINLQIHKKKSSIPINSEGIPISYLYTKFPKEIPIENFHRISPSEIPVGSSHRKFPQAKPMWYFFPRKFCSDRHETIAVICHNCVSRGICSNEALVARRHLATRKVSLPLAIHKTI